MHGHEDFRAQEKHHFGDGFRSVRNEEEHAASSSHGHQHQPEARQQAEGSRGPAAVGPQARLDFRLEKVEMVVDAPRVYATELAIDAVQVAKDDEESAEAQHAEGEEKYRHQAGTPRRRRKPRSRRSISPRSVSWS